MSIKVMSAVWENAPVRQGKLLVLLAMADYADERGVCWPSIGKLAERARLKRRQKQDILKKLLEVGLIRKERLTGRYEPNIYKILCGRGAETTPLGEKQGCSPAPRGVQSSTARGAPHRLLTVTEPSLEPSSGNDADNEIAALEKKMRVR